MENKNIEKDFNLLNIKIKLKKLTIAEIEAAQKGSSQKVVLESTATKRVTRSNCIALGIDIQSQFNDAIRKIDTPKRKKISVPRKPKQNEVNIQTIVSNSEINNVESPKPNSPKVTKRKLTPLDRNEAMKKRRLTENESAVAQSDCFVDCYSVAATVPTPLVQDTTLAIIEFRINEVVWAKIKGLASQD